MRARQLTIADRLHIPYQTKLTAMVQVKAPLERG